MMRGGVPGGSEAGRGGGASAAVQIGENCFERREPLRVHELQQRQFEMQARIGIAAQIVVRGQREY